MKEHFLTYEQALAVKELGFDEPCMGWYASDMSFYTDNKITINSGLLLAPLKSQFFKWVREKYGYLHVVTYFNPAKGQTPGEADYQGAVMFPHQEIHYLPKLSYDSYEQAEDACINKIIELLKLK